MAEAYISRSNLYNGLLDALNNAQNRLSIHSHAREGHHQELSSEPGDDNIIIGHGFRVPLKSPDVVKPHFSRRAVHKSHVDSPAMSIEANPCRVVIPFTKICWVLLFPPIYSGRRRITVCPGTALFSFIFTAYRIGTIPGAVRNHRNLRRVS